MAVAAAAQGRGGGARRAAARVTGRPVPSARRGVRVETGRRPGRESGGTAPKTAAGVGYIADVAEGLEDPVQLAYLGSLLAFLGGAAFFVVRQVLQRRELELAAYELGEKARAGVATSQELYELGSILARKKVYSLAVKHLEEALGGMAEDDVDRAAVHNALGYAYGKMEMWELALGQYNLAVELQPGYVLAWNNLGDVAEKSRDLERAAEAYAEALKFAPENEVAKERLAFVKRRISTYGPRGPAPAPEEPGW